MNGCEDNQMVSVITPAYNAETTLEKTYKSLRSQTYENWEWIIIDDHSSDATFQVIKALAKKDPKIRFFQNETNLGAAKSRNLGIHNAKGRYIAFLDADDLWKPEKLEKQLTYMKQNGFPFTCTGYDIQFESGEKKCFCPKKETLTYKSLLKSNDIGCLTVLFDKEKFPYFEMPIDAPRREDHAAWLDVTKNGTIIHCLQKSLAVYEVSKNSVSGNKLKIIKYQYFVYRKHEGFGIFKSLYYLFLISFRKVFFKY